VLPIVDTGYIYESTKGDQGQLSEVTQPKGMWNSKGLSQLKCGTVQAARVVQESNQNSVLPSQPCISCIIRVSECQSVRVSECQSVCSQSV